MTIRCTAPRAGAALALAAGILAGCQIPQFPGGPATVPEGPEPNGIGIGDVPTAISAAFPVVLTGEVDPGDDSDRFTATLPDPGELIVSCSDDDITVTVRDVSTGGGDEGGCQSSVSLLSDSGAVEVIVHAPTATGYSVRLDYTSSCGLSSRC